MTNLLGGSEHCVRADIHLLDIHPGEVLVLCTEGLTEDVAEEAIVAILAGKLPEGSVPQFIDVANVNGGGDNVTVVIAHFDSRAITKGSS